jgi:cyclic pyranopterin phosphate synthase
VNDNDRFPHLDEAGHARMVDVGDKAVTRRRALAEGSILMDRQTLRAILDRNVEKGDVLAVARIAAVGGAKRTSDLVPLCHPLPLHSVSVEIEAVDEPPGLRFTVETTTEARTGIEMEALCAVTAGLLAVYDMCKSMDRAMELGAVRLLEKEGGRSGMWRRGEPDPRRRDGSTHS